MMAIGITLITLLALTGCGKSSSGGEGKTGESAAVSSTDLARYEKELDAAYEGSYEPPKGAPIDAAPGKNIWLIVIGENIEATQNFEDAAKEVAEQWGWNVHVFDGKFESTKWLTGIQEAIAAKADGIITFGFDCGPVQAGFEQAKQAGIPVVTVEGKPCEPKLASYEFTYNHGQSLGHWLVNEASADQAKWVIAETKGEAKTIVSEETDAWPTRLNRQGIEAQYKKCPTCEIVDVVEFTGPQFGPPLQEKIEQALNQYPEANSFIASYDTVLTSGGGAAALQASGRLGAMKVAGGEGSAPVIELIRGQTGADSCVGIDYAPEAFGTMAAMARIFAGEDPYKQDTGMGAQVCDLKHNLPPKGESFQAPIDYLSEYEKIWGSN